MADTFRHELKYICSDPELITMKLRLSRLMKTDHHALSDGTYIIRSIYYDDYDNNCFFDNESGVNTRKKWRIRCYNCSPDVIKLECKSKMNSMIQKRSCTLTRKWYDLLTNKDKLLSVCDLIDVNNPPLLNEFLMLCQTNVLKPVVIVQYERRPFVYHEGNVRVTFDRSISSSQNIKGFFDKNLSVRPIMPLGMQLLEVKYDEFLPDAVYWAIQKRDLILTAFSKYYLCRSHSIL